MSLNILQQIQESLKSIKTGSKHSYNAFQINRQISSALSDEKIHQREVELMPKQQLQQKTKIKSEMSQIPSKRYQPKKQSIEWKSLPEITEYLKLLKKRRSSNFVLPQNYSERQANQIRKSISLLSNKEEAHSYSQYLQDKKKYVDQQQNSKIYKENIISNAKVLPLINVKKRVLFKSRKDSQNRNLSLEALKIKMDLKQKKDKKEKKLKVVEDGSYAEKASVLLNAYFEMQNYDQILKKMKFQKKVQRHKLQHMSLKPALDQKRSHQRASLYKIFPSSYLIKKKKQNNDGFSPWQSKSSNFVFLSK